MRKLILLLSCCFLLSGCAGTPLFAANPEEQPDALNEKTLAMPDKLAERASVPSFYYHAKPAATYYQSATKEKKLHSLLMTDRMLHIPVRFWTF